jgi:hypothetical protein
MRLPLAAAGASNDKKAIIMISGMKLRAELCGGRWGLQIGKNKRTPHIMQQTSQPLAVVWHKHRSHQANHQSCSGYSL